VEQQKITATAETTDFSSAPDLVRANAL